MSLWKFFFIGQILPRIKTWSRQQKWYKPLITRKGTFAQNGRDDATLNIVVSFHHLFFGGLMLYGAYFNNPDFFAHGALGELGFEIVDLCYNALGLYPYNEGRIKTDLRIVIAAHHGPGILLTIPLLYYGIHDNIHLRTLGGYLLFAGGISTSVISFIYTCDFDDKFELIQATIAHHFNAAFFMYARWYVFPIEMYAFIQDIEQKHLPINVNAVYAAAFLLGTFNFLIMLGIIEKSVGYIRKIRNHKFNMADAEYVPPGEDDSAEYVGLLDLKNGTNGNKKGN
jgi:hypothetical protein